MQTLRQFPANDSLDESIIEEFQRVARCLGVSDGTVGARLKRLIEAKSICLNEEHANQMIGERFAHLPFVTSLEVRPFIKYQKTRPVETSINF